MTSKEHTQEPWGAFKMGNLKTKEEMITYITKCINEGGDEFFFVSSDDDKDICHTGNGIKSFNNAKRIVACTNAMAGITDPMDWRHDVEIFTSKIMNKLNDELFINRKVDIDKALTATDHAMIVQKYENIWKALKLESVALFQKDKS